MVKVYAYRGLTPVVHPDAFVHPSAVLIGDAIVGRHCYVGANATMRGDVGRLILEQGSNLQDNCVMHGHPGRDTVVGENGHIGHGAILHGCVTGARTLVGMGSVVMEDAEIGDDCCVAALSFVKAGFKAPARSLLAGIPARILRQLSDDDLVAMTEGNALYRMLAETSLETMVEVDALTEVTADRGRLPDLDIPGLLRLNRDRAAQ